VLADARERSAPMAAGEAAIGDDQGEVADPVARGTSSWHTDTRARTPWHERAGGTSVREHLVRALSLHIMDILQLEHFLAVVDEGSFTRAAERVHRTQSAISQSVKKIEDSVGAPVFCRDAPELCLTSAGKLLADYARKMVRLRDEAMRSLDDLRRLVAGSVSVAAHESAAVYLLPGPLKTYLRTHPEIKVGIYRSRLDEIPRQVMDREVDLGFVKDEPAFRELTCVQVHADEMVLIGSPSHPFASRPCVLIRDLAEEHFVLHHQCASTTQLVLRLFEQHGSRCKVAAELWSFENVKQFVREEVGFAIVPRICVRQELADGTLAEIPLPELQMPRPTRMVYRDERYLSDAARAFIEIVRAYNWEALPTLPSSDRLPRFAGVRHASPCPVPRIP
jgi:DNA-binding transcriptional LysR family regulator